MYLIICGLSCYIVFKINCTLHCNAHAYSDSPLIMAVLGLDLHFNDIIEFDGKLWNDEKMFY